MAGEVTYYFSMVSPWAYIGHDRFMEIVAQHQLTVSYRPVVLPEVFAETGGIPLGQRHPARQAYRFLELQRWSEKRGLKFNLQPKFWPFDFKLADRVVIALAEAGQNPAPFLALGFRAVWEEERNLAEADVIAELLESAGQKGAAIIKAAGEERIGALYQQYTREAIETGCLGSPCYVLKGEPFWGQDRLDLLDDALRSGREPYVPPAA